MKTPLSQNHMRLRNMYLIEMMHIVEDGHNVAWTHVCRDFLEDNNELHERSDLAFSYNGTTYPEDVTQRTRRHILNRKTSTLHADLTSAFETMKSRYVDDWGPALRAFKNMVTSVFREAASEADLRKVIPDYIIDSIQEIDFIPLKTAQGISDARALEIKEKYDKAFDVEAFISVGKLV